MARLRWLRREPAVPQQPGWPNLRRYTKSAAHYYAMHHALWTSDNPDWSQRAPAQWGLIARGRESVPYAQMMIASTDPEERADGISILGAIATGDPDVVARLIEALRTETDTEVRDTAIVSLQAIKAKEAIPALGAIVADTADDYDTRHLAACALGTLAKRPFHTADDPVEAAANWWASNAGG